MQRLGHTTMWCLRAPVLFWFVARLAVVFGASRDDQPHAFTSSASRRHSDARWLDMSSGLYVDVTKLRYHYHA